MNEERGTTALEGGHIALFLLNIWYMVLPCPPASGARGPAIVRESVPHRAIVSDYVPVDWGARNRDSQLRE